MSTRPGLQLIKIHFKHKKLYSTSHKYEPLLKSFLIGRFRCQHLHMKNDFQESKPFASPSPTSHSWTRSWPRTAATPAAAAAVATTTTTMPFQSRLLSGPRQAHTCTTTTSCTRQRCTEACAINLAPKLFLLFTFRPVQTSCNQLQIHISAKVSRDKVAPSELWASNWCCILVTSLVNFYLVGLFTDSDFTPLGNFWTSVAIFTKNSECFLIIKLTNLQSKILTLRVPLFSEGTLLLLRLVPLKVIIWKMYLVKVDIWDRFI